MLIYFRIILIGHDLSKPIPKFRKLLKEQSASWNSFFICLVLGIIPSAVEADDVDYSKYLGKGYKKEYKRPIGRVSTYVANHTSGLDGPVMLNALSGDVSFIAMDSLEKVPIVGYLIKAAGGIFAPRGSSLEVKQKMVDMMDERQH